MPSRNRVKVYIGDSYYHVYNRGINRRTIFKDVQDYAVFLNLLKRYLSKTPHKDKNGREYESLFGNIELLAFCLMPTHYHLLIHQSEPKAMTSLIRRVGTSYSTYFNKKYGRLGPLFQERFKASRIVNDEYLMHISRYIHLNPKKYKGWEFSSLPYYVGNKRAEWIMPGKITGLFKDDSYPHFLEDYVGHKKALEEIKDQLANSL